jgi:hypothetical protein
MKRWLGVAGAAAVVTLAACSSAPPAAHTVTLAAPHGVTLAADERPGATLDVLTGTSALHINVANLGTGALLRAGTPRGGPLPRLHETSAAAGNGHPGQVTVVELSAPGASAVTVTLNTNVGWRLVLGGGTSRTTVDLRGGHVTGIAFTAGSDVISLALPWPDGPLPVRLAGGASQFLLSLPPGVQARVTAVGGAGEISLAGKDHVGVAGGSVFTTPGWKPDAAGFDIDATAGAARVALTARAG